MTGRAVVLTCVVLGTSSAHAQSATPLDRFDPAPAGDVFAFVPSPDVRGGLRPSVAIALSFAKSPLVLVDPRLADPEIGNIVAHQVALHGLVGIEILHRLKLELDVPVTLEQDGSSPSGGGLTTSSPSGAAMNDIRVGARLALLQQDGYWPSAAASLSTWFPSGSDTSFTSSGHVRLAPALVIGADYGDFVWSTTVGRRFETSAEDNLLGHELLFGAAAGPRFGPLLLAAELWGTTVSQRGTEAFSAATTNVEAHLAVTYEVGPFSFRLAGGPGLTTGIGTPDYRLLGMIGYAPDVPNAWERQRQEERLDAALAVAPSSLPAKGSTSSNELHPHRDTPADADADGVSDRDDACPKVAGVRSTEPTRDGCPRDSDGDAIADDADACPNDHGTPDPNPKKNGCPDAGAARVVGQQIIIAERVTFETGKDELELASAKVLEQIAKVLQDHPEIVRVAIEGHTDNEGDERANIQLSQKRSLSVMRWLIEHGVDERRLEARGFGPRQPLTDNDSEEGRAKNRRVDFRILKRSKLGEAAWTDGGVE